MISTASRVVTHIANFIYFYDHHKEHIKINIVEFLWVAETVEVNGHY